ncbi:MAG: TniQ family protein [Gallionella sp.]|nr:TniQ family protein [Gallionella sp.]
MSITGLSGDLLPLHLKPLPNELLSSWLVRLAHGHGLKLQTFSALVFGRDKSIWNRDIDRLAPNWLVKKLSECTGASMQAVWDTTLKSYEGILYEHHQPNGNTKWILPLGVYHRIRRGHGLQCCPHCLAEDAAPYFRKQWRLALSTVCTKHGCYLLDACPRCSSPLVPHRTDMHGRQYFPPDALNAHCWKCSLDLRSAQVTSVRDSLLVRLQLQLEFALEHGYANWAGNSAMHSIVFFEGLRELIAGITSQQTRDRMKKLVRWSSVVLNDCSCVQFEMTHQAYRRELFHVIAMVMDNWPLNFACLIHECKLRYADMKGDSEQRVMWYEDVIQREAGGGHVLISRDEADAIASAVEARHGHFSGDFARELSGHDINLHVPERLPQPVSDDVYEDLLTSIDHQIAGTMDKTERACLIRDKVMFAVGRQLRLSEGELAGLTHEQMQTLVPDEVELDFSNVARSPAQARAWVEWYWVKMRPQLRPMDDVDCVFTSAITRRGFRHSAVGVRFRIAVDAAMMCRVLKGYQWLSKADSH